MQCARMQPRRRVITVKARLLSPSDPFPISPLLPSLLFSYSSRARFFSLFLSLSLFLSSFHPSHSHRATVSFLAARKLSKENRDRCARCFTRFFPPFSIYLMSSSTVDSRVSRDKSLRRIIVPRSISIPWKNPTRLDSSDTILPRKRQLISALWLMTAPQYTRFSTRSETKSIDASE